MSHFDQLQEFVIKYCENVLTGLHSLWERYTPDIYRNEGPDAIAGLVARQATLAVEMAKNPGIWNGNSAPLFLRAMTDTHITLAWILENPDERGREYIRYGLGQEKLQLEHLEKERDAIPEEDVDPRLEELIEYRRSWLNAQLAEWAIDINVGSWSGKSTRDMASEAKCESLYKFAYMPFSGAAHSMWQHVGLYNVEQCTRPLHKHHRLPLVLDLAPDADFLYRSAKYVSRTYRAISEKLNINLEVPLPVKFFLDNLPSARDDSV